MKNIRRYIHIAGVLLICCALLSSCVAEDLSGCGSRTRLRISFIFEAETETRAAETEKHHVTLYAFDQQGYCQLVHEFDVMGLGGETTIDVPLEPGTYDFVAWLNKDETYFSLPAFEQFPQVKPKKDAAVLYLDIPDNSIVDYELPTLLHGSVEELQITSGQKIFIPLIQNTNRITFTAEGLDRTADTYEFEVRDHNGAYTFENEFDACAPFRYLARTTFADTQNKLSAGMSLLRLASGRTPVFAFRNSTTGKTLYPSSEEQETNLVKMIENAYRNSGKTVDFDKRHEFNIKLKFDAGFNAIVTIDGWNVVDDDSGLRP